MSADTLEPSRFVTELVRIKVEVLLRCPGSQQQAGAVTSPSVHRLTYHALGPKSKNFRPPRLLLAARTVLAIREEKPYYSALVLYDFVCLGFSICYKVGSTINLAIVS